MQLWKLSTYSDSNEMHTILRHVRHEINPEGKPQEQEWRESERGKVFSHLIDRFRVGPNFRVMWKVICRTQRLLQVLATWEKMTSICFPPANVNDNQGKKEKTLNSSRVTWWFLNVFWVCDTNLEKRKNWTVKQKLEKEVKAAFFPIGNLSCCFCDVLYIR